MLSPELTGETNMMSKEPVLILEGIKIATVLASAWGLKIVESKTAAIVLVVSFAFAVLTRFKVFSPATVERLTQGTR